MKHDAFVQAILDKPDEDALRMAYADWLEANGQPDRAEFIRIQCSMPQAHASNDEIDALYNRMEELLDRHWREWLEPLATLLDEPPSLLRRLGRLILPRFRPPVWIYNTSSMLAFSHRYPISLWRRLPPESYHASFSRGFLDCLHLPSRLVLSKAHAIFDAVPLLRKLMLHSIRPAQNEAFANVSEFRQLTELGLNLDFDTPTLEPLISSPHLENIHALDVGMFYFDPAPMRELVAAPMMRRVTRLRVGWFKTAEPLGILLEAPCCGNLTSLGLEWFDCDDFVQAVADSPSCGNLKHLDLFGRNVTDTGIAALARSPHLANLEHLKCLADLGDTAAGMLADSASLKSLREVTVSSRRMTDVGKTLLYNRFGDGALLY